MHISDGYLDPAIIAITWAATIPFLIFAWKKTKNTYNHTTAATLAISSALVFVAQMINFPVAAGASSVHILGGTLLAVILGPYAAMLSLTTVLMIQTFLFGDGGLLAFGANAFNMAVIGGLSFFIVQFLLRRTPGKGRFASSVFIATWSGAVITALLTGLELGFSSAFAGAGGITLTVPTMFSLYAIEGLVEAVVTTGLAASLQFLLPQTIVGFKLLGVSEKL